MKCLTFDPPFENPPGYEYGVGFSVVYFKILSVSLTFYYLHDRFISVFLFVLRVRQDLTSFCTTKAKCFLQKLIKYLEVTLYIIMWMIH